MHSSIHAPAPCTPIRFAAGDAPDPLEAVFRRNIAALSGREPDAGSFDHQYQCGRELDALALRPGRSSGTKAVNLALMRLIRPTRTAAAVITAKNEGCYLLECVAHCRAVGFEHVFIYTNDNSDNSDALLAALGRTPFVTVIRNEVGPFASPQVKAYEHSIHLLRALRDFEWVSYFDVDEFLIPAEHHDYLVIGAIAALRRRHSSGGPSAICYNWNVYGSEGQIRRRPGLVQERFRHSALERMFKSLVRLADVDSMALIHMPNPDGLAFVNAAFEPITAGLDCMTDPPDPVHGTLSHYYQKSFEEFGVKSHRGRGGVPGGLEGKGLDTFFAWDVPATPATCNPAPPRLLARVRQEIAALQAMPEIADAAQAVEQAYQALSRRVNGDDLHARFQSARARFMPHP